eukprot:TRINITY_DN48556_c0_g1_i1.p1 TRINITY_DN48556_c0_g1~~TRINITY_DN48556_c0_g1_i1.p1  ORF type:complete len:228 (+),score=32.53 TRINITY_DN48556_c0_g1_i1:34-684(+)
MGVNLWVAVFADVGSCITVILFSMTILNIDSKTTKQTSKCDNKAGCCANKNQIQNNCCGNKKSKGKKSSCCDHENFSENASILGGIVRSDEDVGNMHVVHIHNDHHEHANKKSCCGHQKNKEVFVEKKFCCGSQKNLTVSKNKCCGGDNHKFNFTFFKKACCEKETEKSCHVNKKPCCGNSQKGSVVQKSCCKSEEKILLWQPKKFNGLQKQMLWR